MRFVKILFWAKDVYVLVENNREEGGGESQKKSSTAHYGKGGSCQILGSMYGPKEPWTTVQIPSISKVIQDSWVCTPEIPNIPHFSVSTKK